MRRYLDFTEHLGARTTHRKGPRFSLKRSGDEAPIPRLEDVELQPLLRQDVVELEDANGALRDRFERYCFGGPRSILRRCDTADRRRQS